MTTKTFKRTGDQCVSVSLPELLQLSQLARQISLSALKLRNSQAGQRLSRLLARGMEFAESRRYQGGDDIRNMDWRVTARTGKPHTKLFVQEKERQVLLAADLRPSMFFATQGAFKSVQAALMMGVVGWNAIQSGDRVGGIIFDGNKLFECRPALGKKGLLPFLHGLAERADFLSGKRELLSTPATSTMDHALTHLRQVASPGSLIFIASDFRQFSSYAQDALLQLSKHCDLCLCFIYDQMEASLPKNGFYPVTDGRGELQLNTYDKRSLQKYLQQFMERRAKVAALGEKRHIHFMECRTEDDYLEILKRHF